MERRERGTIDAITATLIDNSVKEGLWNGLPPTVRNALHLADYTMSSDLYHAINSYASRYRLDIEWFGEEVSPRESPRNRNSGNPRSCDVNNDSRIKENRKSDFNGANTNRNFTIRNDNRNYGNRQQWCRYCRITGHEIEECRKKRYADEREQNLGSCARGPQNNFNNRSDNRDDHNNRNNPYNPRNRDGFDTRDKNNEATYSNPEGYNARNRYYNPNNYKNRNEHDTRNNHHNRDKYYVHNCYSDQDRRDDQGAHDNQRECDHGNSGNATWPANATEFSRANNNHPPRTMQTEFANDPVDISQTLEKTGEEISQ